MNKLDEAKEILAAFGLPPKQQNDRSARVLLSMAYVKPDTSWNDATNTLIRIHDIIEFIAQYYDFHYAENSRETIRRQSIHQFEQAGIVVRNPDDPQRPTNSGLTVYALTPEALAVIRTFGKKTWKTSLKHFLANVDSLVEHYRKDRSFHLISVSIRGKEFTLSPGKHNVLQKAIVETFAPRFAPGSVLLYFGDTVQKYLYLDEEYCQQLKIDITQHDKLPDIMLYQVKRNWLYLIEAVTSHGAVSSKRVIELQEMLKQSSAIPIFVSAFPDFRTFTRYVSEIAWETEVWIADNSDHMIHFNGEKFLRPTS
ncbi:MAG: BsuBI/PstI family type II restriction endonuclease [Candidatus Vecturithrix sp.]|jgi:adenine-specific DNA-methyltransferase|nr:BsuBI/PstI family type II restriction endonuclease [Candidatus Vecturithrix sp.]